MFTSVIVKKIEDSEKNQSYVVGDRIRVLKKSGSEYIGNIKEIHGNGFDIQVDGYVHFILFMDVEKMRIASPGENFYSAFVF